MREERSGASLIINTLAAALFFHVGSVNLLLGREQTARHRRRFWRPEHAAVK